MAEDKTKPAAQKAAPAAKPAAAKKSTAASATQTKAAAAPRKAAPPKTTVKKVAAWNPSNEERYNMVQVAAYYLAERDGFGGSPVEYWAAAEIQITGMLPKR
jgi:hypothetical protein